MPSGRDDLYFIVSPAMGRVKIGRGIPDERMKACRTMCPDPDAYIALVVAGMGGEEKRVHRAWAKLWSHGEWFHLDLKLVEWIKRGAPMAEVPTSNLDHLPAYVNRDHVAAMAAALGGTT